MELTKCFNCQGPTGELNGKEFYQLNHGAYCSLNCFNVKYKELNERPREQEKPTRSRKVSKGKSGTKRSKRATKKRR